MLGWCWDKVLRVARLGPESRGGINCAFLRTCHPATDILWTRFLGATAILAVLLAGFGCSTNRGAWGPTDGQTEEFISKVRPASGDTARLLKNAHYYRQMGRPQVALKELEEAYLMDPDNLKVLDTLAHCYEEVGRFDRAQKLYEEALGRHGDNTALHNNLCFSYYLSGRWEKAEACFRQALARDPGNSTARNNLGLLYCRTGKQEEARRLWRETEGEAGAEQKVKLALGALGVSTSGVYAKSGAAWSRPPAVAAAKAPSVPPAQAQVSAPPVAPAEKPMEVAAKPPLVPRVEAAAPSPATPAPVAKPVKETAAVTPRAIKPAAAKPEAKPAVGVPAVSAAATPAPAVAPTTAPSVETAVSTPPPAPPAAQGQVASISAAPPEKRLEGPVQSAPQEAPLNDAAAALVTSAALGTVAEPVKKIEAAPLEAPKPTVTAKASQPVRNGAPPLPKWLTAKELVHTGIEVRNGNGARRIAHRTRAALSREGFNVTKIGNHVDFGAERTIIYYRPEVSRVARSLNKKFFPTAKMVQARRFNKHVEVKVVLGRDLLKRHDQLARLAME
jgi:Tfp pilus assembly protein PilF